MTPVRSGMRGRVQAELCRQEHGACREHDSGVVQDPGMIKGDEIMDRLGHKGVSLFSKHEVIGDSHRNGLGKDDGVDEERVQWSQATHVKVQVDTAVVVKHEIANRVCSLDWIGVPVESVQEPRIVLCDEFARAGVCPEHIFAVLCVRNWEGDELLNIPH